MVSRTHWEVTADCHYCKHKSHQCHVENLEMLFIWVTGRRNSEQRCVSAMKPQTIILHVQWSFCMTIFWFEHSSPVRAIFARVWIVLLSPRGYLPLNLNGSKLSSAHKFWSWQLMMLTDSLFSWSCLRAQGWFHGWSLLSFLLAINARYNTKRCSVFCISRFSVTFMYWKHMKIPEKTHEGRTFACFLEPTWAGLNRSNLWCFFFVQATRNYIISF